MASNAENISIWWRHHGRSYEAQRNSTKREPKILVFSRIILFVWKICLSTKIIQKWYWCHIYHTFLLMNIFAALYSLIKRSLMYSPEPSPSKVLFKLEKFQRWETTIRIVWHWKFENFQYDPQRYTLSKKILNALSMWHWFSEQKRDAWSEGVLLPKKSITRPLWIHQDRRIFLQMADNAKSVSMSLSCHQTYCARHACFAFCCF